MRIPSSLASRPQFHGYPVPYTAVIQDGTPDFKTIDSEKVQKCMNLRLCGLCGRKIGAQVAFIGGEGSMGSGMFRDPWMHFGCARYAFTVCPFLMGRDYSDKGKAAQSVVSDVRPARMGIYLTTDAKALVLMMGELIVQAQPAQKVVWMEVEQ